MARLILNPTSASRREIQLSRSDLSIGRDPANDLVLSDAMVSRRHAVLEFRGSQFFLRDCNSSNGTLINGERVTENRLKDGDLVAIGATRILFRDEKDMVGETNAPTGDLAVHAQCPSCRADINDKDRFCRQCGAQIVSEPAAKMLCPFCSSIVSLPARFCNSCGTEIPSEGDRMATTRPRPIHESKEAVPPQPHALKADAAPKVTTEPHLEPAPSPVPSPPKPSTAAPSPPAASPIGAAPIAPMPPPIVHPPASPPLEPAPHIARSERPFKPAPPPLSTPLGARPRIATARSFAPAGAWRRLAASMIDSLIVSLGIALLISPALYYWWAWEPGKSGVTYFPVLLSVILVIVAALLASLYYVYYWGIQGATLGKQIFGLVVQDRDGVVPIGVGRATLRLFGYFLSSATLGIGFFLIAFTGYGLHDHIAGTRVVRQDPP